MIGKLSHLVNVRDQFGIYIIFRSNACGKTEVSGFVLQDKDGNQKS